MSETELKPMPPELEEIAAHMMALRAEPKSKVIKERLRVAIDAQAYRLDEAGGNVFQVGPAQVAIRDAKDIYDVYCAHVEMDKLRRFLGFDKPAMLARGGPGGR